MTPDPSLLDPSRDEARRAVASRGLTPVAATMLTNDALGTVDFAALAPVKKLLKRFFSADPWLPSDDEALAALVGAGDGWWRHDLDDDLRFEFGWREGVFVMELATRQLTGPGLSGETFAGSVVPEATPNPRTIRFVTPPIHGGRSRWYESAVEADDPRVARLFAVSDEVANVLVGPDFVAVGLRRPDAWERLLDKMLHAVEAEFTSAGDLEPRGAGGEQADDSPRTRVAPTDDEAGALERAWKELGSLAPDEPGAIERILAGTRSNDRATRQVAARVLVDADTTVAEPAWAALLDDPSRAVRRATVDAVVDAERSTLRPFLEHALGDVDAWTRWKALRGLVNLGIEPSRAAVVPLADDPDFRVRLEAAGALAGTEDG